MFVIPIYIEAGITGFESPAAEYKELGLSLDELLIKHPHATFIGLASGHSMVDAKIFDKDLLIVDRSEAIQNGDIIVATYNGSFVCKIIDTNKRQLLSASDLYKPVSIYEDDQFKVEGVVTACIRTFKNNKSVNSLCMR